MDKYIRVPRRLIRGKGFVPDESSYLRLFFYIYFAIYNNGYGLYPVSLQYLLRHIGIRGKNITNTNKYKVLINFLKDSDLNGSIKILDDIDIAKIKTDKMFIMQYDFEDMMIDGTTADGTPKSSEPFILITLDQFKRLTLDNKSRNPLYDLFVFMYIKSYIWLRGKDESLLEKPMYWYLTNIKIGKDCNFSLVTVRKIVTHLSDDLELIAFEKPNNISKFTKHSSYSNVNVETNLFSNMSTVYVIKEDDWEMELKYGLEAYKKFVEENYKYI